MADASVTPGAATAQGAGDESVKPADFPDLGGAGSTGATRPNLDLVRDIQVKLTVELGRTELPIQEILELAPGKVIELDKLAGEPLDILVNGTLLARGEVVMVDDHFGVRITAILDGKRREAALAAKYSAIVSPYREWVRKQQDAVDLRRIVLPDPDRIDRREAFQRIKTSVAKLA